MARENTFIFFGELVSAPVVIFNEETSTYRVTFILKTVRKNGREDFPKINIYGLSEDEAKNYVSALKPGVFVEVRGMISTKMTKKPVRCEACGHVSQISTLLSEVITYGRPFILNKKIDPREIAEFSNKGNLLGTVCTDVRRNESVDGPFVAQFQIAVSRRYRVAEQVKGERTDYPWIKSYGETAKECKKRLQKGSQVYITGAFQTREVDRHVRCENCNGSLVYTERVGEVTPNGVEFLNNCLFVPKEGEQAASDEGQTHEKA